MAYNATRDNAEALLAACAELWSEQGLVTSVHCLQLSEPRIVFSGDGVAVSRTADVLMAAEGRVIVKAALRATTYAEPDKAPRSTVGRPSVEA
jgi:hypothetical protein